MESFPYVTLRLLFVDPNETTFAVLTGSQGREHAPILHDAFLQLSVTLSITAPTTAPYLRQSISSIELDSTNGHLSSFHHPLALQPSPCSQTPPKQHSSRNQPDNANLSLAGRALESIGSHPRTSVDLHWTFVSLPRSPAIQSSKNAFVVRVRLYEKFIVDFFLFSIRIVRIGSIRSSPASARTHLNILTIAAVGFKPEVSPLFTTGTGTSVYFLRCRYISAPSTWTTKFVSLSYTHLRELILIDSHFYLILLHPGLPPLIASAPCACFCVALSPSHSLRSSYRRAMGFLFSFGELIYCQ